jgi:hypothetical protein
MIDWNNEKRSRFVFFVGLALLALFTINPYEFFSRLDYEIGWVYSDGWLHMLAAALILIGAWKWLDERSVK